MPDDIDILIEIIAALTTKLARDRPKDETLQLLAARAQGLQRKHQEAAFRLKNLNVREAR